MNRRRFVLSGLGTAGALVVGWGVLPPRSRLGVADTLARAEGEVGLNGWIKITHDGGVLLAMNRSEMGQGVHTALAMLVAEELDVPLASVRLIPAGPESLYGNVAAFIAAWPVHQGIAEPGTEPTRIVRAGQWAVAKVARELGINITGGSTTVRDAWDTLRLAAATARAQLLGAASLRWRLPVAELSVTNGVVSHPRSRQRAHYGELAKEAAATPPGDVVLKDAKRWKLIGTAAPRIDLAPKIDGSARFGIDVRLPEQLYAVILHCPMLGGHPGAVDADAALRRPGVERVVRLGGHGGSTEALAVVGTSHWHAQQGARALVVDWRPPPAGTVDSATILGDLEQTARAAARDHGGFAFYSTGDVDAAAQSAARRFEQVYRAPYLAHAAMEPINCTARVSHGTNGMQVEVWAPTQTPTIARAVAARAAGVSDDAVTVNVTYLGGGFGRRLDADFVGQAVRIARETGGRPVQLIWSREEDIGHDFYRPAGVAVMQASLDAQGLPTALTVTTAGDAITPRWIERGLPLLAVPIELFHLPDKTTSEGLFDQAYEIANQRIAHVATTSGVPVGYWRSVGHSHNAFFGECFIDELASEAKLDPVAFRLALLGNAPRHAAVLKLAAEKSGWGTPLPPGMARGVALHESFGSIVAQVAEVSVVAGKPRVHRVVCVADVGTVVNPGIVAQQMEGGVVFGLTAALYSRIDIEGSVVKQRNFPDYPMLQLAETPRIDTHLVPSTRAPGGVGEIGTPPIAPALANALFVLTGKRLRELPLVL
jgi:isoquinoline 1-oxidoreductase beta subunit